LSTLQRRVGCELGMANGLARPVQEPPKAGHQQWSSAGLLAIGRRVDQCSDQSQQLLLLKAFALTEEPSNLDVGHMSIRWDVGLVSDEHPPRIGITGEIPSVTVRAVTKLSDKQGEACCSCAIAISFKRIEDM
jgi:hypothetical protein